MEKQYKYFLIGSLYGLIEFEIPSLSSFIIGNFERRFGKPLSSEEFKFTFEEKFITDSEGFRLWIGTITFTLTINGESYSVTRDWGEEYEYNTKHPDYESDEFFYEGEKCYEYKKIQELKNAIEND